MRRLSLMIVMATLMVSTLLVGMPAAHAGSKATASYYVALGDSLAAGFQPDMGGRLTTGYVGRVFRTFRQEIPGLSIKNLACPGETTAALITGKRSMCHYGAGSQLDAAVSFLGSHAGAIAFITIDVGANDLIFQCLDGRTGLWNRACAKDERPHLKTRLANILDALATAASGVPIVGMQYYDPFLGLWGRVPGGYKLAKADHRVMNLLNAALGTVYGDNGVSIANAAATFRIDDFTDTVVVPGRGRLPLNVALACRWTWFCTQRYFFDPHPNWKGYTRVAHTFNKVLHAVLP